MRFCTVLFMIVIVVATALRSALAVVDLPLIDIKSVDPTIVIELRYGGANNLSGHALYSPGTPALVRPEVAQRLAAAQLFLRRYQYGLKIWDAYRPRSVQMRLWQATHNEDYVADPRAGAGSMHG